MKSTKETKRRDFSKRAQASKNFVKMDRSVFKFIEKHEDIGNNAKRVFLYAHQLRDSRNGVVYFTNVQLARDLNIDRGTARIAVKQLVTKGFLEKLQARYHGMTLVSYYQFPVQLPGFKNSNIIVRRNQKDKIEKVKILLKKSGGKITINYNQENITDYIHSQNMNNANDTSKPEKSVFKKINKAIERVKVSKMSFRPSSRLVDESRVSDFGTPYLNRFIRQLAAEYGFVNQLPKMKNFLSRLYRNHHCGPTKLIAFSSYVESHKHEVKDYINENPFFDIFNYLKDLLINDFLNIYELELNSAKAEYAEAQITSRINNFRKFIVNKETLTKYGNEFKDKMLELRPYLKKATTADLFMDAEDGGLDLAFFSNKILQDPEEGTHFQQFYNMWVCSLDRAVGGSLSGARLTRRLVSKRHELPYFQMPSYSSAVEDKDVEAYSQIM